VLDWVQYGLYGPIWNLNWAERAGRMIQHLLYSSNLNCAIIANTSSGTHVVIGYENSILAIGNISEPRLIILSNPKRNQGGLSK